MAERKSADLRQLTLATLEACRVEVVRRLQVHGLPTTTPVNRLMVTEDSPGHLAWRSESVALSVSSLHINEITMAIHDQDADIIPLVGVGLRHELTPLASHLAALGYLASRSNTEYLDDSAEQNTPETLIFRYLAAFADAYLRSLSDLRTGDEGLASRFASELESFVTATTISRTDHMVVDGIWVESPISHRDVSIRPLSPQERGRYWEIRRPRFGYAFLDEVVMPARLAIGLPRTLIEVTSRRNWNTSPSQGGLVNRVALGLFLVGCPLSGTGITTSFDNPRWAWFGATTLWPSLVQEKVVHELATVSVEDFRAAVDLAHQMADFENEIDYQQIALRRLLRGLGAPWTESGFLDYAIALEAALLHGIKTELSYRFSLYGSLFLKGIRDPAATFRDLRRIYEMRSNMVHGSTIDPSDLTSATTSAAEIARLVIRTAIESGWPDPKQLDRAAFS